MTEINLDFSLWPRQMEAFRSKATEILFGGATEGGKSHLVRVILNVLCLAIPGLQCVLIRKKFDDILKNHVEGPTGFRAMLAPLIEAKAVRVTESGVYYPNGSIIAFQHCQDERQFTSAQGVEKHVLVVDEATQISERLIKFFRAWVRMPLEMKERVPAEYRDKLPLILYTANPIGTSVSYFRRAFVKARPAFAIEKVHGFLRQYIPSRAVDNLSIDQEAHIGRLADLNDEALARALDTGDWDSPIGDFFKTFNDDQHTVPDFHPPEWWFKFRTFDWGSADPFSVLWWCVSDGEDFIDEMGRKRWFPRNALICYREWFGCDPQDQTKGLHLANEDIARGIRERTLEPVSNITLTDSLPFNDMGATRGGNDKRKYTIADVFADNGVPLTKANTKRVFGCAQVRSRLQGITHDKGNIPMMYFVESARYVREYLPAIETDPNNREVCSDHGEASHSVDTVRYAASAKPLAIDRAKSAEERIAEGKVLTPKKILAQLTQKSGANQIGRR